MSNNKTDAATSEQDQQGGLEPKLRFPEFRDAGRWEEKKLSDLLFEPKHRNRSLKYGPNDVLSVSGEYGCVNQIEHMGRSYAGVSVKDYHVVETGDIVYTKSPLKVCPFGIIKENKGRSGIVSTLYAVYRPTEIGQSTYLDHFFSRHYNLNSYLQPIVKKGAKNDMKVNNSDVLTGSIWVPKVDEQQKIAAFLSSMEALIGVEADKLGALKDYKKGLIEQLFPIEGEAVPRLRFPEFQDAEEWEEQTLGSLLQLPPNYGANEPATAYDPNLPTYLRITDISTDGRFIQENRTSVNIQASADNSMRHGDIALTRTGASVGKAYLHRDINGPLVFAGFLIRIRPDERLILSEIVFQFLNSQRYWTWVEKTSARSGQPGINSTEYASLFVPLPKNAHRGGMQEQQKIANCLSSIDTLITALGNKIEALKAYKKGLMQRLFPVVDEVQR